MPPTIDDLLADADALKVSLSAVQSANAAAALAVKKLADDVAAYLGTPAGLDATETAAVTAELTAHLGRLRGLEGDSPETAKFLEGDRMATPEIDALIVQMNDATNVVAARLAALAAQVAAGMSQADADRLKASLTAEVATLTGLGADPNNPIPGPVPPPPAQ